MVYLYIKGCPANFGLVRSLCLILACLWMAPSYSQPSLPKVIQPSPTAASLGKFSEIPIGYHTGVPQISIPITTLAEGSVSVPISLSYHASGIRVSEKASWVGIGWALNCGGAITRSVQHVPDEGPISYNATTSTQTAPTIYRNTTGYYKDGYTLPANLTIPSNLFTESATETEKREYYQFMDACTGNLDTEPDIFSYNIGGYSGTFRFKVSGTGLEIVRTAVFSPRADIKVEVSFNEIQVPLHPGSGTEPRLTFDSFVLIAPDGFRYSFGGNGAREYSGSESYNQTSYQFSSNARFLPTTWYLTEIKAPDGRNVIFEYTDDKYSFFDIAPERCWGGDQYLDLTSQVIMRTVINGKRLSRIASSTEEAIFHAETVREDLSDYENTGGTEEINNVTTKRLDWIEIRKLSGNAYKRFDFGYEYFVSDDNGKLPGFLELNPASRPFFVTDKKRLKLLSVTEKSGDGLLIKPPHVFTYRETNLANEPLKLPRRLSFQQDHWGGYNGAVGNQSLIAFPLAPRNSNRNTSEDYLKLGILASIKYPTGGLTTFEFEANRFIGTVEDPVPPNAATNYTAGTSASDSEHKEVITHFEIKNYTPPPNSPCGNLGIECNLYPVKFSVSAGDPRPISTTYDLNYTAYYDDMLVGVYKEDGTFIEGLKVSHLQFANCTACNSTDFNGCTTSGVSNCKFSSTTNYKTVERTINLTLPPGRYYFKALRIDGPSRADASKEVLFTSNVVFSLPAYADPNYLPPAHTGLTMGAGLRVTKISTTDALTNIVQERRFTYPAPGILYDRPTYYYQVELTELGYNRANGPGSTGYPGYHINDLFASSSILPMQNTQGSPLGYGKVRESIIGNGFTEYLYDTLEPYYNIGQDPYYTGNYSNYNSSNRLYNYPVYPSPQYLERGNLIRKTVYNNAVKRLFQTKYEYEIGHVSLDFRATKTELIHFYQDAWWASYLHYPIFAGTSRLLSTTETTYDQNGENGVSTMTENIYGGFNHLQATEVKRTVGTEQIIEKTIYPPDYKNITSSDGGVKHLQELNYINVPIEKYSVRQDLNGSNQRVTSGLITTFKSDRPLIDKIQVLDIPARILLSDFNPSNKIDNTFSPDARYSGRIDYKSYDTKGNVIEVAKVDDASTSYIWGYNGTLPIAEIKNARADQIFYTSFEDELANVTSDAYSGEQARSAAFTVTLPSPGTYKLTYWKKVSSSDWELVQGSISANTTIGGGMIIDEVRLYPQGSMVTTYAYKIGVGITSIIDANNVITRYEHDELGRLKIIKDSDSNVKQHFKYHYGSQE